MRNHNIVLLSILIDLDTNSNAAHALPSLIL